MATQPTEQPADDQKPADRRTWYRDEYVEQAHKLALLGLTDDEIAASLEVDPSTLGRWKAKKHQFRDAIARGREIADGEVAKGLYDRARGFTRTQQRVARDGMVVQVEEYYPPDTAAASLWLRNRQGGKWRDKTDVNHSGAVRLEAWVLESMPEPARAIEGEARRVEDKTALRDNELYPHLRPPSPD